MFPFNKFVPISMPIESHLIVDRQTDHQMLRHGLYLLANLSLPQYPPYFSIPFLHYVSLFSAPFTPHIKNRSSFLKQGIPVADMCAEIRNVCSILIP